MKFLLDTHTLLWFIEGDAQMSDRARQAIEDTKNEIMVSAVSLFEISIKLKIGKLTLKNALHGFINDVEKAMIKIIPIANSHLIAYQQLPDFSDHRDPFDRLIIATGISEGASVITKDPKFKSYQSYLSVIW